MEGNLLTEQLDIRTVVLVGRQDFGRCPLAARLPMALWPIAGRPALERLLDHLAQEGIRRAVVCSENDISEYIEPVRQRHRLEITTLNEDLTGGTAGCLRDAVGSDTGDLIMVFSGSMVSPPPLRSLIESHRLHGADLTMVFNPERPDSDVPGAPAEIYLCKRDVLRLIPAAGYSDIKEGLIPSILRAGGVVRPFVLATEVGSFHDRCGYLRAVSKHLMEYAEPGQVEGPHGGPRVAPQASVHPSARIWGAVEVGEKARILERAMIVGPAVIGPGAVVGRESVVVRSVLWRDARVGNRCEVFESVLDSAAVLADGAAVAERTVAAGRARKMGEERLKSRRCWKARLTDRVQELMDKLPARARMSPRQAGYLVGGWIVLAAFLWSYWPTFMDLYEVWRRNDEYSAGLLVPFLAAYALWVRRRDFEAVSVRPAVWAGILLFLAAQTVRGLGLYLMFGSAERLSVLMSIVAIAVLLLGWAFLRKLAATLVFLCLMLPWPNRVQAALAVPLQSWATTSAVFCLELAGYEVAREGNIITVENTRVAVAEACNGLRMITAFVVISGLVVLLARRAWWEKLVILISSLPIALFCNTVRLTMTAVAFTFLKGEHVEKLFHDFGGYAMMPLALALVVGELWFLARLTTPPTELSPTVITRRQPRQIPDS
ncbi:MAG TPA: exosortase [Sedimentisphaerales bacterium]|nr:exosortase [Sedimentisphaerales bacterium]HRS10175.1 exosortase [Sedimentisphaerales bacterium]HRV46881.1 exosortase [Sedimentisphaerales bacterium]